MFTDFPGTDRKSKEFLKDRFCFREHLKVSYFQKETVKPRILPKNERMNSFLLVCDVFSFVFWENPRPGKKRFEIIGPLLLLWILSEFDRIMTSLWPHSVLLSFFLVCIEILLLQDGYFQLQARRIVYHL